MHNIYLFESQMICS